MRDHSDGQRHGEALHNVATGVGDDVGDEFFGELVCHPLPVAHSSPGEPGLNLFAKPGVVIAVGEHQDRCRDLHSGDALATCDGVGVA